MKRLLLLFIITSISVPAFAQGTIKVIREDGSVDSLELPSWPTPEQQTAPSKPEPQQQQRPDSIVKTPPVKEPPKKQLSVKELMEAPPEQKILEPALLAPQKITPEPVQKQEKKTNPVQQAAAKPKSVQPKKKNHLIPARKPDLAVLTYEAHQWEKPQDAPITEKMAKHIALDIAPPSRGMTVMRRDFQGKPVFVVRFKTDTGFYDVLVDAQSGNIVGTYQ